jgi:uncharacterized membrane protein YhiD involved in acid resistance
VKKSTQCGPANLSVGGAGELRFRAGQRKPAGALADGMAKVIEGVITGIGFIGGGAILKQGSSVQGTATAASLWATGAIDVAVGLGSFGVAIKNAVFTFLTLMLLTLVEDEKEADEK